jgi:hypothetical protein
MAPQSCNVFVVARFRPMKSREKEISTTGVDEKGLKLQCAAKPPTALDYPVMTHGRCRYGDADVAITGGTAHGEQKFPLDKYLLPCDPLRRCANAYGSMQHRRVFDPDCLQKDIFDHVAQRTIDDILSGFNGTIFAYRPARRSSAISTQ